MPQEVTGTEILRNALKARKKSSAVIARDELAIPSDHLASFIAGTRTLPPDVLCTLATYIFNGAAETSRRWTAYAPQTPRQAQQ